MTEEHRFGHFDPANAMRDMVSPVTLDPDIEEPTPPSPARPSLPHAGLVFVGGAVGTLLRYLVLVHLPNPARSFPLTTASINTVGALLLGFLGAALFDRRPSLVGLRLALATGVLGGWTTYSSIIAAVLLLSHEHSAMWAAGTIVGALLIPVVGAALGLLLGSLVSRRADR